MEKKEILFTTAPSNILTDQRHVQKMSKITEICEDFKKTNNMRHLFMKLPTYISSDLLLEELTKQNIIIDCETDVKTLFNHMKGYWEIEEVCGRGNRVKDVKYYHTDLARDCAVEFAFRIMNNKLTKEDLTHIYNTTLYILGHSRLFTNRIRSHLYNIIIRHRLFKVKQMNRINSERETYGKTYEDNPGEEENRYYTDDDEDEQEDLKTLYDSDS